MSLHPNTILVAGGACGDRVTVSLASLPKVWDLSPYCMVYTHDPASPQLVSWKPPMWHSGASHGMPAYVVEFFGSNKGCSSWACT